MNLTSYHINYNIPMVLWICHASVWLDMSFELYVVAEKNILIHNINTTYRNSAQGLHNDSPAKKELQSSWLSKGNPKTNLD